ncbi:MAG: hypothetical protein J6I37_08625 [Prevotella sp.]|nr:hypothetical protein [Prevotella sp.]
MGQILRPVFRANIGSTLPEGLKGYKNHVCYGCLLVPPHGTFYSMPWNTLLHPMKHLIAFIPVSDSRLWNTLFQALEQGGG